MIAPLTRTLIRILAIGFYREHAGVLACCFGTVLCYCFFITPAGHIDPRDLVMYNLTFTLAVLDAPIVMFTVCVLWLLYTIKSWQYIAKQLRAPENMFLYYSVNAFSRFRQFVSWSLAQFVILLPIIVYGIMILVVGMSYHSYKVPIILWLYILLLGSISARVYMYFMYEQATVPKTALFTQILKSWPKAYFSLPFYNMLHTTPWMGLITKVFSLLVLMSTFYFFNQLENTAVLYMVILITCMSHTILIYRENSFMEMYMPMARNFAYSRARIYGQHVIYYSLLLIPETVVLLTYTDLLTTALLFTFSLGCLLLLRSLLYIPSMYMRRYLWSITGIFTLSFIVILSEGGWLLIAATVTTSFTLCHTYYYQKET